MRLTGALALLLFAAGVTFASGALNIKAAGGGDLPSRACVVAVVLPAGVAGALALFAAARRALSFRALTGATLLTLILIASCALEPVARRQTVKHLLDRAAAAGELPSSHLVPAARAELLRQLGRHREAAAAYTEAIDRAANAVERAHLLRRRGQLPGTPDQHHPPEDQK